MVCIFKEVMNRFSGLFWTLLSAAAFIPASASAAKFDLGENGKLELWGLVQVQANVFGYDDYDCPLDNCGAEESPVPLGREVGHDRADEDGLQFDAERVRFGAKYKIGDWEMAGQFDYKDTDGRREGALGDFIRDIYGGYRFGDAFKVRVGQFKMPHGMAYTNSGTRLPMVERTLTSRLVANRTLGFMLSGRNIGGDKETGGFGYDLAVGNPSGRAPAYEDDDENRQGEDYTYVARLVYDYGEKLHFEVSHATLEDAGQEDVPLLNADGSPMMDADGRVFEKRRPEDYESFDIGMIYKDGPVRIRAEYIDGADVRGIDGFDEDAWFLEGGYRFNDMVEGVVRYQEAECDYCDGATVGGEELDQELSRFEVGANFFLGQNERNGRVQVYYAAVGDDEEAYQGRARGSSGAFATDQFALQLQMRF